MLLWDGCRLSQGQSGHDAAWSLLQKLWKSNFHKPMPPVVRTPRGKPEIPGTGLYISLSHTSHHAFCAVSDRPIGIDAEELNRPIREKLAEKILSPSEKEQFVAASDRRLALLTFWVLKEAAAKRTGEGLCGYPNGTDFRLDDPAVSEWDGCLLAIITEE